MLTVKEMTAADHEAVMPMVMEFYSSPAVEHEVSSAILERSFAAAVDEGEPLLRGLVLLEGAQPVGYCYVTEYYSAEMGGRCLMVEELYLKSQCRGKGYGSQVFSRLAEEFPHHARVRLEVTKVNHGAMRLYKRLGFRFLQYEQMVLDREWED